jgi:3-hydroxyisobutyrate dehydrogenase-like beta-hydroxyacid dehydrogenase
VLFASGAPEDWARAEPVLRDVSEKVFFLGPFGTGTRMKFCANLLVAAHIMAAAEALVLGARSGLDPELVARALADGAGSSLQFRTRAPMMAAADYARTLAPNTMLHKDLELIADFARELGCVTPMLDAADAWFARAAAGPLAARDVATVHELLAAASGLAPRGVPELAATPARRPHDQGP